MPLPREKWLALRHTDRRALKHRVLKFVKGPFLFPSSPSKDPARTVTARRVPKLVRASGPGSYDFETEIVRLYEEGNLEACVEAYKQHTMLRGVLPGTAAFVANWCAESDLALLELDSVPAPT